MSRICYFIPGPMSRGSLGADEARRRSRFLARHAAKRTAVEVHEAADGPVSIESPAEEAAAIPHILEALPRLQAMGFDAIILGCFGDPGLVRARRLVDVPVVGPAEAAAGAAAARGPFAILTVVEEVVPVLARLMTRYGFGTACRAIRPVGVHVSDLRNRRQDVLAALPAEGREAIEAGARCLVLGCMTMGFLDLSSQLEERLECRVVNPVVAALRAAETAAGEPASWRAMRFRRLLSALFISALSSSLSANSNGTAADCPASSNATNVR